MANRNVIGYKSAMPLSMKKSIMIQQGMRMFFNTSPELYSERKVEILNEFNNTMKMSGYPEQFRTEVSLKVVQKYEEVL